MVTKSSTIAAEFKAIQTALEVLEPLDETQRQFALAMILARLGMQTPAIPGGGKLTESGTSGGGGVGGPPAPGVESASKGMREFLRQKSPATDLERYICLAYYLTHHMNTPTFASKQIVKLNGEAGGADFSNAAVTAGNAMRQSKLLSKAGGGKKRITLRGEKLVGALPDRAKVREVIKSRGG